jgi:hypothetical protein
MGTFAKTIIGSRFLWMHFQKSVSTVSLRLCKLVLKIFETKFEAIFETALVLNQAPLWGLFDDTFLVIPLSTIYNMSLFEEP